MALTLPNYSGHSICERRPLRVIYRSFAIFGRIRCIDQCCQSGPIVRKLYHNILYFAMFLSREVFPEVFSLPSHDSSLNSLPENRTNSAYGFMMEALVTVLARRRSRG